MIIAIDGPAASGKGTLGKRLAAHYGLRHLDTGLLYRAVAQALRAEGHRLDDPVKAAVAARAIDPASFDEVALKSHEAGEAASIVSAPRTATETRPARPDPFVTLAISPLARIRKLLAETVTWPAVADPFVLDMIPVAD